MTTERLENADRLWHLRRTRLLKGLPSAELQTISKMCVDRIYSKGSVIFSEGSSVRSLFILQRGKVRLSIGTRSQKEKTLGVLSGGDIFGEDVLGLRRNHVQAMAHEECWVCSIGRKGLLHLLHQRPELWLELFQILNERISLAHRAMYDLSFLGVDLRVAKALLGLGLDHGRVVHSMPGVVRLDLKLTLRALASLVGANRAHVSTVTARFKKRGWIVSEKRKILISAVELERFVRNSHAASQEASLSLASEALDPADIPTLSVTDWALRDKIRSLL